MNRTLSAMTICMAGCIVSAIATADDVESFTAASAGQGTPFVLEATETERLPTKSYLSIPGFHNRTAPGSRSLMCYYTALAIEREFSYWFVVYPAEGSDRVVVGFSNSADDAPEKLLGPDYIKALSIGKDMMPVDKMSVLCGIQVKK